MFGIYLILHSLSLVSTLSHSILYPQHPLVVVVCYGNLLLNLPLDSKTEVSGTFCRALRSDQLQSMQRHSVLHGTSSFGDDYVQFLGNFKALSYNNKSRGVSSQTSMLWATNWSITPRKEPFHSAFFQDSFCPL